MKKAEIIISQSHGTYKIKVEGRANFESSPLIRNLAKNIKNEHVIRISVELGECTGMDSTFMGVLAMLGLEARKHNAPMEILNANEENLKLLEGLGLKRLFNFVNTVSDNNELFDTKNWSRSSVKKTTSAIDRAETVYEAHDTLMEVDENNIPKFKQVVEMTKKDLDNLKKGKS